MTAILEESQFIQPSNSFQIYFYMPPLESTSSNGKFRTMIPADNFEHPSIAYIDLDLPPSSDPQEGSYGMMLDPFSPDSLPRRSRRKDSCDGGRGDSGTAYKKIDFVKTEAFNRTRHNVEEKYSKEQV